MTYAPFVLISIKTIKYWKCTHKKKKKLRSWRTHNCVFVFYKKSITWDFMHFFYFLPFLYLIWAISGKDILIKKRRKKNYTVTHTHTTYIFLWVIYCLVKTYNAQNNTNRRNQKTAIFIFYKFQPGAGNVIYYAVCKAFIILPFVVRI